MVLTNSFHLFAGEMGLDRLAKNALDHISHPFWDQFFGWITQLGSPVTFIILGITALIIMLLTQRTIQGIMLNLCLLLTWISMNLLKNLFARPRPAGEHLTYATGYSYPSGHAMVSMAFYGFLAYLILNSVPGKKGKGGAGLLLLLVFLIGVSRIYLNVHYASDVLTGFVLGGLMVYLFVRLDRYIFRQG